MGADFKTMLQSSIYSFHTDFNTYSFSTSKSKAVITKKEEEKKRFIA
jgi:hypothetical protein